MEKNDHICARCAAREKGCMDCCTEPFLDGDNGFYLTFSDISRISKHTGLAPDKFCMINHVDKETIEQNPDDYCLELHSGNKWIGMNGQGRCMFLGKEGCTIFEARPMICRIHPFWFEMVGGSFKLTLDRSPGPDRRLCIVEDKLGSDQKIAEILSGSTDAVLKDTETFIHEMELHKRYLPLLDIMELSSVLKLIEQSAEEKPREQAIKATPIAAQP